jgi:hypothetical protein
MPNDARRITLSTNLECAATRPGLALHCRPNSLRGPAKARVARVSSADVITLRERSLLRGPRSYPSSIPLPQLNIAIIWPPFVGEPGVPLASRDALRATCVVAGYRAQSTSWWCGTGRRPKYPGKVSRRRDARHGCKRRIGRRGIRCTHTTRKFLEPHIATFF